MFKLLIALVLISVVRCQYDQNTVFPNSFALNGNNYGLAWDTTTDEIIFRITVRTTGWVGFGISPNGEMENSDVILAWTKSDGSTDFRDAHTEGKNVVYDATRNWNMLFYNQVNGVTTVIFKRKFLVYLLFSSLYSPFFSSPFLFRPFISYFPF